MNAVADTASTAEPEVTEIAAALARWYADHSPIRRLWAIEDPVALKVLVALEPTSDGDDTLPVWLANSGLWATICGCACSAKCSCSWWSRAPSESLTSTLTQSRLRR